MAANGGSDSDFNFMGEALSMANLAAEMGEVPVGAVITLDGQIVAKSQNLKESTNCPTHHAEILAIEAAAKTLGRWRLSDCELFVTLEPCIMCAGAIVQARLKRVIYGAIDPKGGAVESLYQVLSDARLNHRPMITKELRADESALLLKTFFQDRRKQKESAPSVLG